MFNQSMNPYNTSNYFGTITPQYQPSGMFYQIQNSSDVNNIPIGMGMVAAVNLQENLLYLKSINNGIATYKIIPCSESIKNNDTNLLEQRLSTMEQQLNKLLASLNKTNSNSEKESIPWDA